MKNEVLFRTFICTVLFSLLLCYTNDIISQQTCPVGFNLPDDSDLTIPPCAEIDIDDGVVVVTDEICNVQFNIIIDVDMDVAVEELFLDIDLVDENLNYENILCFDNIFVVIPPGGFEEGTDCGVDHTFQVSNNSGGPIILQEVMDAFLVGINVNRPNEFEDNCYHFVFELTYLDINGFSCSYFGELEIWFPQLVNSNYTCGTIGYAGLEECEFPSTAESPLAQIENFNSSFQGTFTSQCDHTSPINPQNIYTDGDQFCVIVPPGGCTEIEMIDCPSGDTRQCVTAADLLELRSLILGIKNQTKGSFGGLLSDSNQSGAVSTYDLWLIQEWILGIENPETRVGDCVIFDPTDDGLDGVALDGLGGWSDNNYTVEVCDGEEFEIVMGVIGDVNGDCSCNIVEGLTDEEEELLFTWNENYFKFGVPSVLFYDMSLDIVGDLSSVIVSEELNNIAMVNVYHREEGYQGEEGYIGEDRYTILINSSNAQAISLEECMSYISFECNGDIEFTEKSFLINDNVKVQSLQLNSNIITPRNTTKEEKVEQYSIDVIGSRIFINQEENEISELYLYAYDGNLVHSQKVNAGDYVIDLSSHLSSVTNGTLFFVVGVTKNGTIVEKLLW